MQVQQDDGAAGGAGGEDATDADYAAEAMPDLADGAGPALRARREAKRLTLDHIAAETRIPIRHLEAIENGEFEELPSRTYSIGFARSYARVVGLDEAAIADQVREELGDAGPRYSSMSADMEPGDPAKLPSAGLVWFGGFAALILVLGVIAFASTYFGAGTGPGPIEGEDVAEAQPDPAAQPRAAAAAATAAAGDAGEDAEVVFTALEDGVWVRFYEADGERLFEAQMESGETFRLPKSASEPRINTGRPDAFAITVGGREVPKLATEPVTLGDTPISAAALLARARGSTGEGN
ncbi:MAG: helix-turn-helix domain-containing protein [Erythrobacter sp.]|jgi:cytoskeletal protein RodZ|nr:helix-turn-helix domain-containing protein [Erythrobacter sp.]